MPLYSYVCESCGVRFARQLSYKDYGAAHISCPKCGSAHVRRRIGRPRMLRGANDLSNIDDPGELVEDPRAMARMMREMGSEAGGGLGPEFDEVIGRLEKGQSPEEIERELPDLGGLGGDDIDAGEEI